jgi:hypothetical protein
LCGGFLIITPKEQKTMRQARLLLFALLALFAFGAVSAAVASAEDPNAPMLLILEGSKVSELKGTFSGGEGTLAALGGKALTGTSGTATLGGCKESAAGAKDTDLCESTLTIKGVKQGAVACRSESSAGTKDAIETILVVGDDHGASETNSAKELEGLLLFKVLGQAGGEEELTVNCGGVKDKAKGVLGCLLTPGLRTLASTEEGTLACKQNATTHDAETGTCEQLCEWLTEHPFETNLGAGFEDSWMTVSGKGKLNLAVFGDD